MKKIMYLNPLGISDYDSAFVNMAQEYKDADTSVTIASLAQDFGNMNQLEYRSYMSLVEADTIKAVRQANIEGYEGLVIGCFYDPALLAAREIAGDMIVVAPCQASCQVALMLANNFSVIIGRWKWKDEMEETIHSYGYGEKLASFREVSLTPPEFITNKNAGNLIKNAALKAVKEDLAESIILGCTLEVGFYKEVQDFILEQTGLVVPVIDASIASLKMVEGAVGMKQKTSGYWKTSKAWGMESPSEEQLSTFGIFQQPYAFGNRIDTTN